ncbi:MAG: phosphopentomutase/phosphoglucosamine mutase [Methanoregulaceae archaeon]|nr:phosphopentomutase/phosphoglucosamine mutase [Methanoregulaceae archaeon]
MLFGSSGIRQRYGQDLKDITLALGSAIGRPGTEILVGKDTRMTGPILGNLLAAGILAAGGDICDAGMVPTPTVAFGTREYTVGAMITASHNPEEYNGVKLFNSDGSSVSRYQQNQIEEAMRKTRWRKWDEQGEIQQVDAMTPYLHAIMENLESLDGLTLILDCGNGVGSLASPRLLSNLGAEVCCVNCNPSGHFARPSEPLEEHLKYLASMVTKKNAKGAVVHDGDADRMMAFDGRGKFISGDKLLMLFVTYMGFKEVVTTYDASMALEELATVRRTPIGDSYVSDELTRWGNFGGEPSGAWIFPEHSLCPDGPYAAAMFCEMAQEWDIPTEIDALPVYPVLRESLSYEKAAEVMTFLGASSPTDGIRLKEEGGWCLIRASGTEPKIRLTAEGLRREKAREMLEKGRALLKTWKSA